MTSLGAGGIAHGRAAAAAAALLALMLAGCGGREHSNPFDPENPDTGGVPVVLQATAGCRRVDLQWRDLGMADIAGFRIWRQEAAAPAPAPAAKALADDPLGPMVRSYADTTAANGTDYRYTLEFLFHGDDRAITSPAAARPGAARLWVADPCGWGLASISPDGRVQLARVAFGSSVLDLQIDPSSHRAYAALLESGTIRVSDTRDGEVLDTWIAPGATCVSWQPSLALAAVGAFYDRTLSWIDADGETVGQMALDSYPEDVALRDSTTTWVALYDGRVQRVRLEPGGPQVETMTTTLGRAVRLLDDPQGGGCWVADREGGAVVYLDDDVGSVATEPGVVREPIDVAPAAAGGCWVADREGRSLVRIDRAGAVQERFDGMGRIAGVAEDPLTRTLWLTVPEDGELRRIDADGTTTAIVLAGCPRRIAGDWSGGCAP